MEKQYRDLLPHFRIDRLRTGIHTRSKILALTAGFLFLGIAASAQQIPAFNHVLYAKVIDAESGEAVAGAEVIVEETGNRSYPDAQGEFHFHLDPGTYHIRTNRMGYAENVIHLDLYADTLITIRMEPRAFEMEEVIVRSTFIEGDLRRTPVNTRVLGREFLERNYNSTFSEGLEKIPGLNSINTGVGIAKPVVRGLQGNRITVNDHGIRQEGQQWGSDHGLEIDPYNVDRAEVIRGAASLMYGSDAMGGVINILEPRTEPRGTFKSSVLGVFRGNNDHIGTSVAVSGRPSDFFFDARATWQEYGDYRVPADEFVYNGFVLPIEGQRLKNTAGRERHFSASAGKVMRRGTVRLTASNYSQTTGLFPGAVGIPRAYALNHDGDHRNTDIPRQRINHFKTVLNSRLRIGGGRWETDAGFQRNDRREESFPEVHGQGPRPENNLALGLDLITLTLNTRYHKQHNEAWKTVFGFNGQIQQNERSGFEFLLSDFRTAQGGIFAMAEYAPKTELTFSFGLRQDFARVDIDPHFMPVYASPEEIIGETQRGPEVTAVFGQPSGAAGLSWNPADAWNLKVNIGRSFRFPTAPELGMNGVHHGTFRHEQGDPTLTPETGWQLDAGIYHYRDKVSFALTPYVNYFDNFIFLRPTATFSPLPEAGQLFLYTQARAFHTGSEAEVTWNPMRKLSLNTSLEYVYNLNLDTYLPLPFTPPLLARAEATWYFKRERRRDVYFFAEAVTASAQNRTDRNEKATPGYTLFHAGFAASKPIGRFNFSLSVQVRNIGDTFYLQHLSRYRLLELPEPGRNVMVSLLISAA